jgi:DNA polymerase III alpha subunit
MWELLEHEEFVDQLFHLNGHTNILKKLKPTNIQQLASVLAIIRPAKRHLIDKDWSTIADEVWEKSEDGAYYFKKAHAVGYAMAVVVHMNLLCEKINYEYS